MSRPSAARRLLGLALSVTLAGLAVPVLSFSAASATPSPTTTPSPSPSTPVVCAPGEMSLDHFSAQVAGDDAVYTVPEFEPAYVAATSAGGTSEVTVSYDPDHDGTADAVAEGCTLGFQLEAYQAEGASWETSGTQTWVDGAGGTISAVEPSLTLSVAVPTCYYQTDFSSQDAEFGDDDLNDGTGNPVPHYPDTYTPGGIASSTGGETDCAAGGTVVPTPPTAAIDCSGVGLLVTFSPQPGVVWSVDGEVVTTATTLVEVAEDATYDVVVTAAPEAGTTFPDGQVTSWPFEGTRDCDQVEPAVVTPPAPTATGTCGTPSAATVSTPVTTGVVWSVNGAVVTTPTTVVPTTSTWSVTVAAAAAAGTTFPAGAQTSWVLTGTLACGTTPGAGPETSVEGTKIPASRRAPAGAAQLARTGVEAGMLAAASGGLLVLGGGLVLLARRRRTV